MPEIDVDFAWEALKTLLNIEKDWVPSAKGTSLLYKTFYDCYRSLFGSTSF